MAHFDYVRLPITKIIPYIQFNLIINNVKSKLKLILNVINS